MRARAVELEERSFERPGQVMRVGSAGSAELIELSQDCALLHYDAEECQPLVRALPNLACPVLLSARNAMPWTRAAAALASTVHVDRAELIARFDGAFYLPDRDAEIEPPAIEAEWARLYEALLAHGGRRPADYLGAFEPELPRILEARRESDPDDEKKRGEALLLVYRELLAAQRACEEGRRANEEAQRIIASLRAAQGAFEQRSRAQDEELRALRDQLSSRLVQSFQRVNGWLTAHGVDTRRLGELLHGARRA